MKSRKAKTQHVSFRRKREGKTNYKKRLKLLRSGKPRIVIRPSLKSISIQIIEYGSKGDRVLLSARGEELEKYGWKFSKANLPSAYLTGLLLGKKAEEKVKEGVVDIGLATLTKGSRIFACIKGIVDTKMNIPHGENIAPSEERIRGDHISKYAAQVKEQKREDKKQFSSYEKQGVDPSKISEVFEEVKKKVLAGEKINA